MAPPPSDLHQPLLESSKGPLTARNVSHDGLSVIWSDVPHSDASVDVSYQMPEDALKHGALEDMTGIYANQRVASIAPVHECGRAETVHRYLENGMDVLPSRVIVASGQRKEALQHEQQQQSTCVVIITPQPCSPDLQETTIVDPESLRKQKPSESRTAEEDCVETADTEKKMTLAEATYTAFNWTMNNGLFSVPFVFASIGFSASGLIVFIGMACTATALLVGEVLEQVSLSGIAQPTYADSVHAAFGKRLAALCSLVCYAELAAYVVNNVICFGLTVKNMCPWLEFEWVIAATCVLSVLLSGLSDKAFAYTSLVSAVSMCLSCAAVLVSGIEMPEWMEASQVTGSMQDYPSAFSLILFGAAVHPLLPSLYEGTKSKHDYQQVVCSVWVLWGLWAILWAGAIYYMFGDAVQPMVTSNIARDVTLKRIPSLGWVDTFHSAWMCLRLQICSPAFARPLVTCLAKFLGSSVPQGNGGAMGMLFSIPVFLTVAISARRLEHKLTWLESVAGSLLMSLNALVIPALSYLLVCREAPAYRRIGAGSLFVLGAMLVIFSSFFPKLE